MILRYFLFLILTSSSLISCNNKEATTTKEEEVLVENNTTEQQKSETFAELPLLAQYINELGVSFEYIDESEEVPLLLMNNKVELNQDQYGALDFEFINSSNAKFSFDESGTSGGVEEYLSFHLIDQEQPIIVTISTSLNSSFLSNLDYSKVHQRMEELMEEKNIEEEKADYISKTEFEWDQMGDFQSLVNQDVDNASFDISIYQKSNGKWDYMNEKVFDLQSIQSIEQHYPFLIGNTSEGSISIEEKIFPPSFYSNNKKKLQEAFGNANSNEYGMEFVFDGDDILIEIVEGRGIRFQWDGHKYIPKNWLPVGKWEDKSCEKINFQTGGAYRFKGKIDNQHAIEMQIQCSPQKGALEIKGEYWYTKNPKSKMPIEGIMNADLNLKTTFHRLKKGNKREVFGCYISNCRLEGYWQHLENFNISKFYLELVE